MARRARQATSHGQNCHLAREDGLIQGFHERRSRGLAVPRLGVASRGFRPKETDLNTPPKHKESLPLSVAARGSSVAPTLRPLFRCSIPGSANTLMGYSARGGGYGSIRGTAAGESGPYGSYGVTALPAAHRSGDAGRIDMWESPSLGPRVRADGNFCWCAARPTLSGCAGDFWQQLDAVPAGPRQSLGCARLQGVDREQCHAKVGYSSEQSL